MPAVTMSIQACLPASCKSRHNIKPIPKTPSFLRHGSNRQNTGASAKLKSANRRSAVERLEESKANYVKSERVLDSKQEFKNSSHLHVSTGPHLDLLLKAPPKLSQDFSNLSSSLSIDLNISSSRSSEQTNITPHKSPTATRSRAKSHSEGRDTQIRRNLSFASRGSSSRIGALVDIESQLKLLLTSSSKENIADTTENVFFSSAQVSEAQAVPNVYKPPEVPKVRRGYSDPTHKGCWNEVEVENQYGIHKSMPNLSPPSRLSQPVQAKSFPSDDVDDPVFTNSVVVSGTVHVQQTTTLSRHLLAKDDDEAPPKNCYSTSRRFSNGTGTLHLTAYIPQSNQFQRHPVSRSKSDVSHRYIKRNSEYFMKRNNNYTTAEIERFFDTMGLDTTVWHHITSPSSVSSPPCFFESVSSIDSNDRSSVGSEESLPIVSKEGIRNFDLRGHGPLETSIVEKNARVIKWLYNCRKAIQKS